MKQNPELDVIQENMMPGALSAHGFLGEDSRNLKDILRDDLEALNKTGISQNSLADKMQKMTSLGMEGLGRPTPMDGMFEIEVEDYKGKIPCPFKDNVSVAKRQTLVRRLDTGVIMRWTDLNIHMIREHAFFEGHGSIYRHDPVELARFLALI